MSSFYKPPGSGICGFRDFEVQHVEPGLLHGSRGGEWEGSSTPSNRVWLGNISATATIRSVRSVFSKFGPLADVAVFPARIGPLGYAFVNFERVSDAAGAYQALNNVVLPALSGCKQLKMRFKPAKVTVTIILLNCHLAQGSIEPPVSYSSCAVVGAPPKPASLACTPYCCAVTCTLSLGCHESVVSSLSAAHVLESHWLRHPALLHMHP